MSSDRWELKSLREQRTPADWHAQFIRGVNTFVARLRANTDEEAADIASRLLRQLNGEPVELVRGEVVEWFGATIP